ncbi:MAG TPA: hypothetical protein VFE37_23590 [Chloroflexota bacterium]|nr:hypothetical protein [Chloroflexota bacterium]
MAVDPTMLQAPASSAWRGVAASPAPAAAAPAAASAARDETTRAAQRLSARATLSLTMVLVIAFLGMHGGELAVAAISGDKDVLLRAFEHLSTASGSVLAVLAALFAPSPLQR